MWLANYHMYYCYLIFYLLNNCTVHDQRSLFSESKISFKFSRVGLVAFWLVIQANWVLVELLSSGHPGILSRRGNRILKKSEKPLSRRNATIDRILEDVNGQTNMLKDIERHLFIVFFDDWFNSKGLNSIC